MKKLILALTILCFLITSVFGTFPVYARDFVLPAPGARVNLSPAFNPPILKGIKVHPDNPFRFDFIMDVGAVNNRPQGKGAINNRPYKDEAIRLIKYFLASLTIPEKDLWVNLSPYEKDRIIPPSFGLTEMGRDLLAEDYMLKQITASLIYPAGETGKRFWKRIYEEAAKKFGTTNIPVNTFNKVWIVPEKAVVYENAKAGTAYVVESKLKVMLEQDYLALEKNRRQPGDIINGGQPGDMFQKGTTRNVSPSTLPSEPRVESESTPGKSRYALPATNNMASQIIREIVIPQLIKEVNSGQNFAQLRQVYNSLILATWYKKKIKDSILAQVYEDKKKIAGVEYDKSVISGHSSLSFPNVSVGNPAKGDVEAIYQRYLQAFKKGVYNYIKEELDPATQQPIPRKYFSGGLRLIVPLQETIDGATVNLGRQNSQYIENVRLDAAMTGVGEYGAMIKMTKEETHNKDLENFMSDYSGSIYYPAAGLDIEGLMNLVHIFPKVSNFTFVDPLNAAEYLASYPQHARWLTGNDLTLKVKAIEEILRARIGEYLKTLNVEIIDSNKKELLITLTAKDEGLLNSVFNGRTIKIRYLIEDLFNFNENFDVIYIKGPGFGGLLSLYQNFWEKMYQQLSSGGHLLVSADLINKPDNYAFIEKGYLAHPHGIRYLEMHDYQKNEAMITRLDAAMNEGKTDGAMVHQFPDKVEQFLKRGILSLSEEELTRRIADSLDAIDHFYFRQLIPDVDQVSFISKVRAILGSGESKDKKLTEISNLLPQDQQRAKQIADHILKRTQAVLEQSKQPKKMDVVGVFLEHETKENFDEVFPTLNKIMKVAREQRRPVIFLNENAGMPLEELEKGALGVGKQEFDKLIKELENYDVHISQGQPFEIQRLTTAKRIFERQREKIRKDRKGPKILSGSMESYQKSLRTFYNTLYSEKTITATVLDEEMDFSTWLNYQLYNYKIKLGFLDLANLKDVIKYFINFSKAREEILSKKTLNRIADMYKGQIKPIVVIIWGSSHFQLMQNLNLQTMRGMSVMFNTNFLTDLYESQPLEWAMYARLLIPEMPENLLDDLLRLQKDFLTVERRLFLPSQLRPKTRQIMEKLLPSEWIAEVSPFISKKIMEPISYFGDAAMKGKEIEIPIYPSKNPAMLGKTKTGGIDFNSDKMNLQVQNAGEGIKFHIDPAQLAQLQNAPGFVPVIISVQPMTDLRLWLGLNNKEHILST